MLGSHSKLSSRSRTESGGRMYGYGTVRYGYPTLIAIRCDNYLGSAEVERTHFRKKVPHVASCWPPIFCLPNINMYRLPESSYSTMEFLVSFRLIQVVFGVVRTKHSMLSLTGSFGCCSRRSFSCKWKYYKCELLGVCRTSEVLSQLKVGVLGVIRVDSHVTIEIIIIFFGY